MSAPTAILPGWCERGALVAITRAGAFQGITTIERLTNTMVVTTSGIRYRQSDFRETNDGPTRIKPLTDETVVSQRKRALMDKLTKRIGDVAKHGQSADIAIGWIETFCKRARVRLIEIEAGRP